MESLLKLSGLLTDADGNKTDLGTLEKRLAEKSNQSQSSANSIRSGSFNIAQQTTESHTSHQSTPQVESHPSPKSPVTSPEPRNEKHEQKSRNVEEAVDDLSDMMCSLVTNNYGETRYIGGCLLQSHWCLGSILMVHRFIIWPFDILSQRNTMGK